MREFHSFIQQRPGTVLTSTLQTHLVTQPIEAALLATGGSIFRAIKDNPPAWLNFANRIKSKVLFKEALIHGAGQFNTPLVRTSLRHGQLPSSVLFVLIEKAHAIRDAVRMAERRLGSYYPQMLMREKTFDRENISRANYSNDVITWMALCWFRHWINDMMVTDQGHMADDLGRSFIAMIATGGDAYMNKQQLVTQFHLPFPMTSKGMACIEHRLSEIKESVKQWCFVSFDALLSSMKPIANHDAGAFEEQRPAPTSRVLHLHRSR